MKTDARTNDTHFTQIHELNIHLTFLRLGSPETK